MLAVAGGSAARPPSPPRSRRWRTSPVSTPAPGRLAANAAGLVSALGAQLACLNAAARLLFALGRETGGAGALLTRTWRRHGSPAGALTVTGAVSVAALLAFGFEHAATRAATLIMQYGAYLMLAAYLMTILAALAWTSCTGQRALPLAILTAGAAILGYVVYRTFARSPPPLRLGRAGRRRQHGGRGHDPARPRPPATDARLPAAGGHGCGGLRSRHQGTVTCRARSKHKKGKKAPVPKAETAAIDVAGLHLIDAPGGCPSPSGLSVACRSWCCCDTGRPG